jgi:hypothetical protein
MREMREVTRADREREGGREGANHDVSFLNPSSAKSLPASHPIGPPAQPLLELQSQLLFVEFIGWLVVTHFVEIVSLPGTKGFN